MISTSKTKFTLHQDYINFKLGETEIRLATLTPFSHREPIGCAVLLLPLATLMLVTGIVLLYFDAGIPFLFRHFSQETTAQVIDCTMIEAKQYGHIPYLTYTYTWNNQILRDGESIYGYNLDDCESYLNQTVAIRVLEPDPSQTNLIAAETSRPIRGDIFTIVMFLMMATFGGYAVYFFLYTIILKIRARIIYPRLVRQGVLLEGEILSVRGYSPNKTQDYAVVVRYGFETPRKKYLKGYAETKRNDLKGTSLPVVGSPVTVLYADDHAHMML